MGWLAAHEWGWLLLSALLGAVVTAFLVLRRVPVYGTRTTTARTATATATAAGAAGAGTVAAGADAVAAKRRKDTERGSIKGVSASRRYLTTDAGDYADTHADRWFRTEEEARQAGFTRWDAVSTGTAATETVATTESAATGTVAAAGAGAAAVGAAGAASTRRQEVPEGRFGRGSADPREDGSAPAEWFVIKGNADSMLYHTDESPSYRQTKAEIWFDTEESAQAAGFRRWDHKRG